jgi:hypothetical protein
VAALTLASLGLAAGAGALAQSAPPCSAGCDVHLGTYRGTNDQGKAVVIHVAVGHLRSGPHIVATVHIIDHFKTEYVVTCGSVRANTSVDSTHWGHINGVAGHWRYGDKSMHVLWAPHEVPTGDVETRSHQCHGITHFRVHHVGH